MTLHIEGQEVLGGIPDGYHELALSLLVSHLERNHPGVLLPSRPPPDGDADGPPPLHVQHAINTYLGRELSYDVDLWGDDCDGDDFAPRLGEVSWRQAWYLYHASGIRTRIGNVDDWCCRICHASWDMYFTGGCPRCPAWQGVTFLDPAGRTARARAHLLRVARIVGKFVRWRRLVFWQAWLKVIFKPGGRGYHLSEAEFVAVTI